MPVNSVESAPRPRTCPLPPCGFASTRLLRFWYAVHCGRYAHRDRPPAITPEMRRAAEAPLRLVRIGKHR